MRFDRIESKIGNIGDGGQQGLELYMSKRTFEVGYLKPAISRFFHICIGLMPINVLFYLCYGSDETPIRLSEGLFDALRVTLDGHLHVDGGFGEV